MTKTIISSTNEKKMCIKRDAEIIFTVHL